MLQIQADVLKTLVWRVGNSLLVHRLSHALKMFHGIGNTYPRENWVRVLDRECRRLWLCFFMQGSINDCWSKAFWIPIGHCKPCSALNYKIRCRREFRTGSHIRLFLFNNVLRWCTGRHTHPISNTYMALNFSKSDSWVRLPDEE